MSGFQRQFCQVVVSQVFPWNCSPSGGQSCSPAGAWAGLEDGLLRLCLIWLLTGTPWRTPPGSSPHGDLLSHECFCQERSRRKPQGPFMALSQKFHTITLTTFSLLEVNYEIQSTFQERWITLHCLIDFWSYFKATTGGIYKVFDKFSKKYVAKIDLMLAIYVSITGDSV